MKSIILTGMISFFVLFPGYRSHDSHLQKLEPLSACRPSGESSLFERGEVSQYDLIYLFAKVGKGEIEYIGREVLDSLPVHHVRSSFSQLGTVDNEDIYGTADGFLPLVVNRSISSFGGLRLVTEKYDQENHILEIYKKNGDIVEKERINSDERIQNLILLFFYLRQQELEPGKKIPVNLPKEKFVLEVKGVTELEVPCGSFTTFELSSSGGELKVWISTQENPQVVKAVLNNSLLGHLSMVLSGFGRREA